MQSGFYWLLSRKDGGWTVGEYNGVWDIVASDHVYEQQEIEVEFKVGPYIGKEPLATT